MSLETFFSVSEQCSLFLLSVILGMGIGVFYDVFRTLRIVFPPAAKKNAVFVEDIVFMVVSGAAVFLYAAVLCRGQVRFFCVVGTLLGFALYIATVGSIIVGIFRSAAGFFARLLPKNRKNNYKSYIPD
ncbi:MAG: spore cortex biosynthesis protein YabQ [Oscillospiraceae bacterium]